MTDLERIEKKIEQVERKIDIILHALRMDGSHSKEELDARARTAVIKWREKQAAKANKGLSLNK